MTDAQAALEAASRIHQRVSRETWDGSNASDRSVMATADALLAWL